MAQKEAIMAVRQAKGEQAKPAQDYCEMVWEAVETVIKETGLTWPDRVQHGFGINKEGCICLLAK